MENRNICFLMFLLFITFYTSLVVAEKELPLGMEDFPPFEFEKDGKIVGVDTEIIEMVLKRLGYAPKIEMMPWKRVQIYAKRGILAGIYSLTKTKEREKFYYFSDPINSVRDVFFKLKKNKIAWNTLDDLKNYKLGASSGYGYPEVFMKALKSKKFKSVDMLIGQSVEQRHLKRLLLGRIDICICEISVCQYLIKQNSPGFDSIDFIDKTIGEERYYYIGFSKKWPGAERIVKEFNVELSKFIAEGKRNAIFNKYGVPEMLD